MGKKINPPYISGLIQKKQPILSRRFYSRGQPKQLDTGRGEIGRYAEKQLENEALPGSQRRKSCDETLKPGGHLHLYPPQVLTHPSFQWQSCLSLCTTHSLMSEKRGKKTWFTCICQPNCRMLCKLSLVLHILIIIIIIIIIMRSCG